MKKKKKTPPYMKNELYAGVVSSGDCTGLTAKIPLSEPEAESYKDIRDLPIMPEYEAKPKKR